MFFPTRKLAPMLNSMAGLQTICFLTLENLQVCTAKKMCLGTPAELRIALAILDS